LWSFVSWLIQTKFMGRSLYRAKKAPDFSTHTLRNVLNDGRINWQRLICKVAASVAAYLAPYIDHRRRQAFIVDDTLFSRQYSKSTELLARVYDHDSHTYLRGFRTLTLGWSDGNTFLPIDYALMSSKDQKQRLGAPAETADRRSVAGQRRNQAQRKMNDVTVELIKQAVANGIEAPFVLFDSWFSSPKMFWTLKSLGMDSIAMVKRSSKVYFRYRGRQYSVKGLYERFSHSKRKTKSQYLYSCFVTATYQGKDGSHEFPIHLVFVRNRGKSNAYLVLATTNISLTPEQIIQMYGRRWQIEGYFKVGKQYLRLDKSQIQSYDGLCGHMAMVMLTYTILAWQQRLNTDDRTLGDLFFELGKPLPDIRESQALSWLLASLTKLGSDLIGSARETLNNILDTWMTIMPENLVEMLGQ
ncbi:IS4 family transposase, partial [Schleiferilactobacillus harbinensis]|uniref:IS4 family transposase n=1 Tax=Schleiferilactobacillus harbinensis TaxID=304207 RepID=UPI0021A825F2